MFVLVLCTYSVVRDGEKSCALFARSREAMRALHGDVSLLCIVLSLTNIAKFMEGNAERTWYSVRSKTSEKLLRTHSVSVSSPKMVLLSVDIRI